MDRHRLHARPLGLDVRPKGVRAPARRGSLPARGQHALRAHCRPGHLS